jgi:two-component system cell cycle sensor histidine kinase/response regulator CckA
MPGMRGPEVAREVLKVHAGIAVVFMSGYADRELELGDLQVKWHFLQKPVNLRELARKVRTALDAGVGTAVTESTAAKVR